jgi:cephalosporin hydroxylase
MNERERFREEVIARVRRNGRDESLRRASSAWLAAADAAKYEYNFSWLGRPIIQYPQDIVALQEIIWRTRPEVIVETGVAHGGSTVLYASMLALLGGDRRVVAVDVEIRPHNGEALDAHPLRDRMILLQGSSTDEAIARRVRELAAGKAAMVCLDADHRHRHVLAELELYSPLVRPGGYLIVFDTSIEALAPGGCEGRPWGRGDNPRTAVDEFLGRCDRFEIDRAIDDQLMITSAPGGFLRCIKG